MAPLTALPISLLSRILTFLCDEEYCDDQLLRHAKLHGPDYYFPLRHPEIHISLDRLRTVNAALPSQLLSPALASPILAAAAFRLLRYGMPYLTDRNTEGRLPLWVKAFPTHVQAVSVADVGDECEAGLSNLLKSRIREKLCSEAGELFREFSANQVRLNVLDLVQVPFNECDEMQAALMGGLCATFESCRSTLKELALPVSSNSEICTRALETITLPHLTLLSIELKEKRGRVSYRQVLHLNEQVLGMMRAVDGHADRERGLTILEELRLINLFDVPCTKSRESGCSVGFFQAIKTLRVSMDHCTSGTRSSESVFFCQFPNLERLHWTGMPSPWHWAFGKLCKRLEEVHICHHHWIAGAQVGVIRQKNDFQDYINRVPSTVAESKGKISTLVTYDGLSSNDVRLIASRCPNLRYLSLHVVHENVRELGRLVRKCEGLTGLEIIVDERLHGKFAQDDWKKIGQAVPRQHAKLCELAIQAGERVPLKAVREEIAMDCLVDAVVRMGSRLERLAFRAKGRCEKKARTMNGLARVLDACLKYSERLSFLEIHIIPCSGAVPRTDKHGNDLRSLLPASESLLASGRALIQSRPRLTKIDLGLWHGFLNH